MKKISIILSGGLGNQLFQLFSALNYAKQLEVPCIELGVGFYSHAAEPRVFDLFDCVDYQKIITNFQGIDIQFIDNKLHKTIFRLANRLPGKLANLLSINNDHVDQSNLSPAFLHVGYKQDVKILPAREILSQCFQEPKIPHKYDIGIHIRRGDYLNPKFQNYGLVDLVSIKAVVDRIGFFGRKIVVFSDSDIKEELFSIFRDQNNLDICFASDLKISAAEEFLLMRSCPTLVCSNSTFSWWAALSSDCSNKVFIPDHWYKDVPTPSKFVFSNATLFPVKLQ